MYIKQIQVKLAGTIKQYGIMKMEQLTMMYDKDGIIKQEGIMK